jgi:predicted RNA-binding Zn-ribbon protein involved in translation (DUF1610 family)
MKKIFREYLLEIIILFLVLVLVILRFVNFGIQGLIQRMFFGAAAQAENIYLRTVNRLISFSLNFSVTDFLGLVFIVGAIGFVFLRIRHHFRSNADYDATVCPRCGSSISRVHRSSFDRLLGKTILPNSRRYRCTNKSCGWDGLRHQRYRAEAPITEREASQGR